MKKTKILIPALSIASVGAIVAPIVTSCNKNENVIWMEFYEEEGYQPDFYKELEITKGTKYTFKVDPKSTDKWTASGYANYLYINQSKETNDNEFVKDVVVKQGGTVKVWTKVGDTAFEAKTEADRLVKTGGIVELTFEAIKDCSKLLVNFYCD